MSRFTKRGRRVAALGAVGLGACAVLAACSPVQLGAAAIVGNQRITVSTLDTQVSNLQAAAKPYGSTPMLTSAQEPTEVLSWLIMFAVMDQVAATNGISVTQAQAQAGLSTLSALAQQDGDSSTAELLIRYGVPPQLFPQVGRWGAEQTAYALLNNGTTLDQAECTAAQTLNIQVSPQFGRFDYATASFDVVAAANTLSAPEGTPKPASTEGLTPAAC